MLEGMGFPRGKCDAALRRVRLLDLGPTGARAKLDVGKAIATIGHSDAMERKKPVPAPDPELKYATPADGKRSSGAPTVAHAAVPRDPVSSKAIFAPPLKRAASDPADKSSPMPHLRLTQRWVRPGLRWVIARAAALVPPVRSP